MTRPQPISTLFPYTTLFRSNCARIRLFGWAGADMEGNKKDGEDYGENYVHFGAEFWSNHHASATTDPVAKTRSEEYTSELQSRFDLVCRLLLEKKKNQTTKL